MIAGDRREVLDHDWEVEFLGYGAEVAAEIVGVELLHTWRAHHDPGSAGFSSGAAIIEARIEAGTGSADDDWNASFHVLHGGLEDSLTLAVRDARHLARDAERDEPRDAVLDEEIDGAAEAHGIELAVLVERRR